MRAGTPTALGIVLRSRREALGLGLREVARKTGVSATYLSRLETGAEPNPPTEETLRRIAVVIRHDKPAGTLYQFRFDALMVAAGRIPSDVLAIVLRGGPVLWDELRRGSR